MTAPYDHPSPESALPTVSGEELVASVNTPVAPSISAFEAQQALQGIHDVAPSTTNPDADTTIVPTFTPPTTPVIQATPITGPLLPNGVASNEKHPGNPTFVMLQDLDDLIQEWCSSEKGMRDPGSYPACTHESAIKNYYNKSAINHHPAVYENLAGEKLEVAVVPLQGWSPRRYIMVAWGRDGVPMIIHTKGKKGNAGHNVPFFFWKGVSGDDQGFEADPSIRKTFGRSPKSDNTATPNKTSTSAPAAKKPAPFASKLSVPAPATLPNRLTVKNPSAPLFPHLVKPEQVQGGRGHDGAKPQDRVANNPDNVKAPQRSNDDITDGELLQAVQHHVDEWRASSKGSEPPPFAAGVGMENPYRSQKGTPCHYESPSGERLKAKRFDIGYGRPTILVAYGKDQPPVIVKNNKSSKGAGHNKGYAIWRGMAKQFEKKAAVYKVFHERNGGRKSTAELVKMEDEDEFDPSTSASRGPLKRARSMSSLQPKSSKRTRIDDEDEDEEEPSTRKPRSVKRVAGYADPSSSETGTNGARSPTTTSTRAASSTRVHTVRNGNNTAAARILEHMKLNASFDFLGRDSSEPPRTRPFGKCSDVRKLFMNAKAAGLFGAEASPGHRMLSAEVEGMEEGVIVLDDDEEDFERLVEAILMAPVWKVVGGGKVEGTCTVTVRADF